MVRAINDPFHQLRLNRLCESFLLHKEFSRRLEEDLVPRLPVEKEILAALDTGPEGPFEKRPDLLPEIAQRSPIQTTRMLASIALLRQGDFEGTFPGARLALESDDPELAVEAALGFAHWRVRLCPQELWRQRQLWRILEVAGAVRRESPLRSRAAAAIVLVKCGIYGDLSEAGLEHEELDRLRDALHEGLSSRDSDLRFTCEMALQEHEAVARALDSEDKQQRLVARHTALFSVSFRA